MSPDGRGLIMTIGELQEAINKTSESKRIAEKCIDAIDRIESIEVNFKAKNKEVDHRGRIISDDKFTFCFQPSNKQMTSTVISCFEEMYQESDKELNILLAKKEKLEKYLETL